MASRSLTTTTIASVLSSSAPPFCWKYDVFLSFRGTDTRKSITSELYDLLKKKGIKTFMDDQDLQVGEEISPTLRTAIAESRFAIVILSKDYASSTWCLEEITKICQCIKDKNRILPLFYQVEPTDVRHQKKSFEEAFTNHENSGLHRSDKLQQWRDTLNQVASLSGWHTEAYKTDRQLLQDIVEFVLSKVQPIDIKTGVFEATRQALKLKLLSTNPLVGDAEEKQISRPEVRKWLVELKDTLYHARDLLYEIDTEAQRRKLEGDESGSSCSSSHCVRNLCEFDKALELKMVDILEQLEVIVNEKDAFGLKVVDKNKPESKTLETTSLVDDSDVYGRNEDKETIKKLLLSDDATCEKISVIPIVGMGGIGKTTLAQLLYSDVGKEFDVQVWVCVSEKFDILKVTRAIYESITSTSCAITQLDLIQQQLKKSLVNKKFLIVLDDFWNENYNDWEALKLPFKSGAFGSKIIVTTRNEGVASLMRTLPSHNLKQISDEDCWLLFAKHAFGSNILVTEHPDLAEIGRQIAKKCKGLPLSAKSLGGLLRCEPSKEKWERIMESDIWELSRKGSDILPALWISYRYLPSHLKPCFSYCSIFPKDYKFRKSELVLMWMAEDLLQPEKMKTMEEVGDDYFNTLISRSFFQPSQLGYTFTMHDLISDLAKYVSGDFCLRSEDEDSLNDLSKTRHFSHLKGRYDGSKKIEALNTAKSLHTFISVGDYYHEMPKVLHNLLPTLQCLRFLNLSGYDVTELPSSIGNLKHLRHLDLSGTQVEHLPDTLCTLYNMQTLLLDNCHALYQLPTNLGRLVNLRYLDIEGTKIKRMPPYMGGMKDLQYLRKFEVSKDAGYSIEELRELQHLGRRLCISRLENIVSDKDASEANMRGKKNLNELVLRWSDSVIDSSEKDRQVLEHLQPHTNLKKLKIVSYGATKFPNWVGDHSFSNLVSVGLVRCEFCLSLPPLGQLPSLEELHIWGLNGVVSIGSEFCGYTDGVKPFRSLKYMRIEDMLEWQKWVYVGGDQEEESAIFPNLSRLHLCNCPKLTKILPLDNFPKLEDVFLINLKCFAGPLSRGTQSPKLECFPEEGPPTSLSTLSIHNCPLLEQRCQRENGEDWPMIAHIPSISLNGRKI